MSTVLSTLYPKMSIPHLYGKSEAGSKFAKRASRQTDSVNFANTFVLPPTNQSVTAIVFGDGLTHPRLYPLTKRRSEAAIPIAGNYRLIDAVVSNCINSNIAKVYALTQFNSTSLNSHLSRAYSSARLSNEGFVEVIAAYQSPEDNAWFQGTADAIRRCLWVLDEHPVDELLVLPGHHLYKMDYSQLTDVHRRSRADITISVSTHASLEDATFGVLKVNSENRVTEFLDNLETDSNTIGDQSFTSMGIYVINRDVMRKLLTEHFPNANDLKSEVIPGAISLGMKVHTFRFDGYWESMRSIAAYYCANMEAIRRMSKANYNFCDPQLPLYTLPRHLPPTLITDAIIVDSTIGDGCILDKCRIKGSVIGMRTKIGNDAVIEDSILMGSDTYCQNEGEACLNIPVGIGEGSYIRKSIVDKNARIGKNVRIINKDDVQEANMEANDYVISEGIVVILRNAVILDDTIL